MEENPYLPKKYKILKIFPQTKDTSIFRVDCKFNHKPGQFVNVGIFGYGECPISICSYSIDYIDLCIRDVGNVTHAIHQKRQGEELWIRGPYGNGYPLEQFVDRDIILVGGGTGVAPLLGALEYIEKNRGRFGKVHLLFGFRNDEAILFSELFEKWGSMFHFEFTLDCKSSKMQCNTGAVTALIDKTEFNKNSVALICGPPVMIKFVVASLLVKDISDFNMYISMERLMSCGLGKCGHCEVGGKYVCKHGPVFRYTVAKNMID